MKQRCVVVVCMAAFALAAVNLRAQQPGATPGAANAVYEQHALRNAGDPAKGRELFNDMRLANCKLCHAVQGEGGAVGPDLSFIGGKFDRPHLIESILDPSRQIVQGYATTLVETRNGQSFVGVVTERDDGHITLLDVAAQRHRIPLGDVRKNSDLPVSLMPAGVAQALTPEQFTDLIAYLESLRPGGKLKMGAAVAGPITLPEGFEVRTIATGLSGATAFDVLPDGRLLVCEQTGAVRVVEKGRLLDEPFVTLPVDFNWERGVIGVTYDPQFPDEPYVYVCWVAAEPYPHHRISRFRMQDNTAAPDSEKLLLAGDDQTKTGGKVPAGHQGGALHFGPDGKLYIGIGEHTDAKQAQRLDSFLGKILRINADGTIPADNPLLDQTQGKYQAIWSLGCRNPFTFAFRAPDGLMLINDVGGKFEEINVGVAGANYGWPTVEHGDEPGYQQAGFHGPLHWYPQSSINGGDFCPDDSLWPAAWRGRYFFADFVQGWIRTIDPQNPKSVREFASGIRRPVDLRFAPDGSLYALLRNAWVIDGNFEGGTGSILRIRPTKETSLSPVAPQAASKDAVTIVEAMHEGRPQFKIVTQSAMYLYDRAGGGFSRMVDRDGRDWIAFSKEPLSQNPASAAAGYRGLPNTVFRGPDKGAGHPGFDQCVSEQVDSNGIRTVSKSGEWAWTWTFTPTTAHCRIERVSLNHPYWFLYEGPVAGRFFPATHYWGTDQGGPRDERPSAEGDAVTGHWRWVYFGDDAADRVFFVAQLGPRDDQPDLLRYMGSTREGNAAPDGMVVFGFGRAPRAKPLLTQPHDFVIGFIEQSVRTAADHQAVAKRIEDLAVHDANR